MVYYSVHIKSSAIFLTLNTKVSNLEEALSEACCVVKRPWMYFGAEPSNNKDRRVIICNSDNTIAAEILVP